VSHFSLYNLPTITIGAPPVEVATKPTTPTPPSEPGNAVLDSQIPSLEQAESHEETGTASVVLKAPAQDDERIKRNFEVALQVGRHENLNQWALATPGVSQGKFYQYARGRIEPVVGTALKIAHSGGVTVEQLWGPLAFDPPKIVNRAPRPERQEGNRDKETGE
jgi:hypothetical protein